MDANVRGGPTTRTRGGGAAAANAAAVAANGGGAGAHSAACSVGNKRPRRATRGGSLEKAAVEDTSAAKVVSVAIVDDGISSPAATQGDCSASSGGHSNGLATPDAEREHFCQELLACFCLVSINPRGPCCFCCGGRCEMGEAFVPRRLSLDRENKPKILPLWFSDQRVRSCRRGLIIAEGQRLKR